MRTGRNGIDTALVPGVAFGQATQREVTSFYGTVLCNSLLGIGGTTGVEAAIIAKKRTYAGFIAGYQENQKAAH